MNYIKTFLTVNLLLLSFFSFSQYDPKPGDKHIVLGFAANNSLVMLRKFKTETICNRYKLNLNYQINSTSDQTSLYGSKSQNKYYGFGINGSFGKQKNFKIYDNFIPYLAIDLSVGSNYQQTNFENSVFDSLMANKRENNPNRRIINSLSTNKFEALYAIASINPVIGFNYYFHKSFALGVEYQFNLVTTSFTVLSNRESKSESSSLIIDYSPNQTTYTVVESKPDPIKTKNDSSFGINGNFSGTGYITASYYF